MVVLDEEDVQSKGGDNLGVGAPGASARTAPSASQVSLGSQGAGVRQLDDILAQATDEEEGVPSHLVFAQKVNLNVAKHTPAPLALFEFKYVLQLSHLPLQDDVFAGVGQGVVVVLQGPWLCRISLLLFGFAGFFLFLFDLCRNRIQGFLRGDLWLVPQICDSQA